MTELGRLERTLWDTDTRFDRAAMDSLLAPDFEEFGRSGRRYLRDEILSSEPDKRPIHAILHDLTERPISDTVRLVTYRSQEIDGRQTAWAYRSSLWDKSTGRWQLQFHQGTPTEALS